MSQVILAEFKRQLETRWAEAQQKGLDKVSVNSYYLWDFTKMVLEENPKASRAALLNKRAAASYTADNRSNCELEAADVAVLLS